MKYLSKLGFQYKHIWATWVVLCMSICIYPHISLAQTEISPLVGQAIRAFRDGNFEDAREKANQAILSGKYTMVQRRDLYYIRGYGFFLENNYPEALQDFDMVLDVKSNDKQSQLLKAECYYYMNKYDLASMNFVLTERLWKPEEDHYANMLSYIKAMEGKCEYKMGNYAGALSLLYKAYKLDSTVMDVHETLGDVHFTLKNYDSAIVHYSNSINLYQTNNDNSIYAWVQRGKVYDTLGKNDDALNNYKEAIRLKPKEREPHWLSAYVYERKKQTSLSLKYFQNALERTDSSDIESLKLLNKEIGVMYKRNSDYENAISYFKTALVFDERYKEAYAEMADSYVENKQYKESVDPYEKAIYLFGSEGKDSLLISGLCLKLGDIYKKLNNETKAKECYLSALKWNKGNNTASMNQANVLFANKKFKEAIPFYQKVYNNPLNSDSLVLQEAYYKEGMCYLTLKDSSNAIKSFEKSVAFKTNKNEAQVKLSEIYTARKQFNKVNDLLGNLDSSIKKFDTAALVDLYYRKGIGNLSVGDAANAKTNLEKCVQYNPNNKKAVLALAQAQAQTGSLTEAEESYTKCIDLYKNEKDSLLKMLLYRAEVRNKLKNPTDALGDLETANKLKPNQPDITKSIIQTNINASDFAKAMGLLTTVYAKMIKPNEAAKQASFYVLKAQCNMGLGQTDRALADANKAIGFQKENKEAAQLIAEINGSTIATTNTESPKPSTTFDSSLVAKNATKPTTELPKVVETPKVDTTAKPIEMPKPVEAPKVDTIAKPIETPKVDTTAKPIEVPKPVETPKVDTIAKPIETPKVDTIAKPIEVPKPVESPKVDTIAKTVETPKVDTTAKPIEVPKPVEAPKMDTVAKPIETPKVDTTTKQIEAPKPVETPKVDTIAKPIEIPKVDTTAKPIEVPKPVETPKVDTIAKPIETPKADTTAKPIEVPKPVEAPKVDTIAKPIETPKVDTTAKPIEVPKPVETPKMDTVAKPIETPKVDTTAKPIEVPKPVEAPKIDTVAKPIETPKVDTTAKPIEVPKPVEAPKVDTIAKPIETPKADTTAKPIEVPKPVETPKVDTIAKPIETPKVDTTAKPIEVPKPVEVPKMDSSSLPTDSAKSPAKKDDEHAFMLKPTPYFKQSESTAKLMLYSVYAWNRIFPSLSLNHHKKQHFS